MREKQIHHINGQHQVAKSRTPSISLVIPTGFFSPLVVTGFIAHHDKAMEANNLTNAVQSNFSLIKPPELSMSMWFSDGEISALAAISALINLTGSAANSLMIFAILNQEIFARNPTNILLLSQSFADLGINLIVGSFYMYNLYNWIFEICLLVAKVLGLASVFSILALAVNRLISIYRPMEYPRIVTSTRAKLIVILIWSFCVRVMVLNLFGMYTGVRELQGNTRFFVILSMLVFVFCYILIHKVAVRHRTAIRNQVHFVTGQQAGREADLKSSCSLAILTTTYIVSWLPITTLALIVDRYENPEGFYRLGAVFALLAFLSSATNPFFYYLRSQNFRQFAQRFNRIYIASRLEFPVSGIQIGIVFSRKNMKNSRVGPAVEREVERDEYPMQEDMPRSQAFVIGIPSHY